VVDHIGAAARKIQKLNPPAEKEQKILNDALDKLKQRMDTIAERQKHIHIADHFTYHWRTVDTYKKAM